MSGAIVSAGREAEGGPSSLSFRGDLFSFARARLNEGRAVCLSAAGAPDSAWVTAAAAKTTR